LYGIAIDLGLLALISSWHYLGKDFLDLSSGQGAVVSDFTGNGIFQLFAKNSSGVEVENWGFDGSWLVEKAQDDIIFRPWESTGSQIADESLVALLWFTCSDDGNGTLDLVIGRSLASGSQYFAECNSLKGQKSGSNSESSGCHEQGASSCGSTYKTSKASTAASR
jgi:hypothetical protein